MYRLFFKRFFDIVVSTVALVVLTIPFLLIAVIIWLDSRGPVFFMQERTGLNGKAFEIYKFRTMTENTPHEKATAELEDADCHITRVGVFLRKTSVDELPQLFNVLRGEMSMIGPRPVILSETELIKMRHCNGADKVFPGLTGLAQVHGRDKTSNFKKASYDGVYALTISFRTDLKIVLRTVWYVLLHIGIHEGKRRDMREGSTNSAFDNVVTAKKSGSSQDIVKNIQNVHL